MDRGRGSRWRQWEGVGRVYVTCRSLPPAAVPFEPGTLTAVALDSHGRAVATAERKTNGKPAGLTLAVDSPSELTGTGTHLLLDGQDAALLRASVVDDSGRVVVLADINISFRVIRGPGVIQGTHNGDPHSRLPNDSPHYPAYHGLVRAVVRVTSVAGRPAAERALLAGVEVRGPMAPRSRGEAQGESEVDAAIVVEAYSPGYAPAVVSIPVSTDPDRAGVMAAASKYAGKSVSFF